MEQDHRSGKRSRFARLGQALVEVMVALTALTVGFMGVLALLTQSLNANRLAAVEYVATYLAVEGAEAVKVVIDSNIAAVPSRPWDDGLSGGAASGQRYTVDPSATDIHYGFLSLLATGAEVPTLRYCAYLKKYIKTTDYCSGSTANSGPSFQRFVTISRPNSSEIKVVAHVSTTIPGSGAFGLDVETHYFNWTQ